MQIALQELGNLRRDALTHSVLGIMPEQLLLLAHHL